MKNIQNRSNKQREFEIKIKALIGCVKMSEKKKRNFDYKKVYRKMLEDKYLK